MGHRLYSRLVAMHGPSTLSGLGENKQPGSPHTICNVCTYHKMNSLEPHSNLYYIVSARALV